MGFEVVDGYLLGERVAKTDVVAALLADRSATPAAAPFYRALEAVGPRAADEAFLALRLVLAGRMPADDAVCRLRALAALARACAADDPAGAAAVLRRERGPLGELAEMPTATAAERTALRGAAAEAFARELSHEPPGERNAERDSLR